MLEGQTTLIFAAFLYLALPGMVWLVLKDAVDRSVSWWCIGGVMAGSGIVLVGLRPWVPAVLSFPLANTCVFASLVMWSQSLRITLNCPWPVRRVVLGLLVYAGVYSVLMTWFSLYVRSLFVWTVLGVGAFYTALQAWRLSRKINNGNAATISVVYVFWGALLMMQSLLSDPSSPRLNPFSGQWDAGLLALTALVTAMVGHFCYVGMVLELTANEQLRARSAQRAAEQAQLMEGPIRHLDRHRRMVLLSGSLAHELKQPLAVALMNVELAQCQSNADSKAMPELMKLLDTVEDGIHRMMQILQRIRAGIDAHTPVFHTIDLQHVLDTALIQLAPEMQRLEVSLEQQRSSQPLWCQGDEVELSQVLVNLLRNAVQAMAGQTTRRLMVSCRAEMGEAQVRVCDSGPGLSAELAERWGEPFLSTQPSGLGMGLAISRDIVARHQGELTLHNRPQGGVEAVLALLLNGGAHD